MQLRPMEGRQLVQMISSDAGSSDGASDVESPRKAGGGHLDARQSAWWQSAVILTGEIMGTGLLSLPHACAKLGWVAGLTSSVVFALTAMYAGGLVS